MFTQTLAGLCRAALATDVIALVDRLRLVSGNSHCLRYTSSGLQLRLRIPTTALLSEIEFFKVTDKWTRRFHVMKYLGAVNTSPPHEPPVERGGSDHTERRRGEINPKALPNKREESR